MRVEIDGVLYVPATPGLVSVDDDLALQIAQECTAALYFGETHKAMGVVYRILGMVAPGAQLIHDQDSPQAAYYSVHPEAPND